MFRLGQFIMVLFLFLFLFFVLFCKIIIIMYIRIIKKIKILYFVVFISFCRVIRTVVLGTYFRAIILIITTLCVANRYRLLQWLTIHSIVYIINITIYAFVYNKLLSSFFSYIYLKKIRFAQNLCNSGKYNIEYFE